MDDIIIYSKTLEDHHKHLEEVFQLWIDAGLKLNPDKCDFYQKQILFLGYLISKDGIWPNPTLVQKIANCSKPITKTKVQSFLGLASFYRHFIRDFLRIAWPLYNLTKQDVIFSWSEDCEETFNYLKNCLTSHPVVVYPNFTKSFYLYTDVSN